MAGNEEAIVSQDSEAPESKTVPAQDEVKKKKKKSKKTDGEGDGDGEEASEKMDTETLVRSLAHLSASSTPASVHADSQRTISAANVGQHAFWATQPMRRPDERPESGGPIEGPDKIVRQEPFNLPPGFGWCTCNIDDETEMMDIYTLLCENYVEDDDNMFRFDYSIPFLQWALKPPHFVRDWHVGVRAEKSGKLVGFITAIPASVRAWTHNFTSVEINFLCVHKKLRSKRLAPVLIKEVTRRVNVRGIFQAVYTAGATLPTPVASCRYYHRSLNPKKLIEVGFSRLAPRMTMARTLKLYKLPDDPTYPRLRPLQAGDVPSASRLLSRFLHHKDASGEYRVQLAVEFNEAEFAYWFMPREGVIYTFVIPDEETGIITDMLSFYALPSTIIGNKQYPTLRAAYSFYNVATTVPFQALMQDALVLAKKLDFDVFNALNIMSNEEALKELKFGIGDGHLQYYLYNWRCRDMSPQDVGLVLL